MIQLDPRFNYQRDLELILNTMYPEATEFYEYKIENVVSHIKRRAEKLHEATFKEDMGK